MMKKKLAVFACVVSLTAASLSTSALAAPTFTEVLNGQLQEALDQMKGAETALPGGVALGLELSVEDTAKAMLGMVPGMDLSWLESIGIALEAGAKEKNGVASLAASVNDKTIVSVNALIDSASETLYLQSPELSADSLKITMEELAQLAEANGATSSVDKETQAMIQTIAANLAAYSYDPDTMIDLIKDFYAIIFKAYVDDGSEEDTVTVGDISQSATKLTAHMDGDSTMAMMEELLIFVRDSEEIQNIYNAAVEGVESAPAYGEIQTQIDNMLPEITSIEEEIPVYAEMVLWIDENEKAIATQSTTTAEGETVSMKLLQPTDGDTHAFSLEADVDESTAVTVNGTGTVDGNLLSGSYALAVSGTEFGTVEVSDYDVAAAEEGFINGTYDFTFSIPEDFQNGSLSILNNFGLTAKIASDKTACSADLTVTTGGVGLATLSLHGAAVDEVAGLDPAATENAISMTEGMEDYLAGIDITGLLGSLQEAGMPEEFLNTILSNLG